MVTKPSTEQTQDFSIHNEDFPALPGPNYKDATLNNDESKTVSVTQGTLTLHQPPLLFKKKKINKKKYIYIYILVEHQAE